MTLPHRLFWGGLLLLGWTFVARPQLSESIQKQTLQGPTPFSVTTVRKKLQLSGDSDETTIDPVVKTTLAQLASLELEENERVTALWNVAGEDKRTKAQQQLNQVPPLTYRVDPRFFDPLTPSIIRRTIEAYGYALTPLPTSTINQRDNSGDHREQLMTVMSLVHHKMLSAEQAAMVLQGAMDLLALQTERKQLEEELRARFEGPDSEL